MTVISKNISDKKSDNLKEPLVENIVVDDSNESKKIDVETGGYPVPPPQRTRYIISARVKPYYSLMFILMIVLLVATTLLGIFASEYLYEQYKYFFGDEPKSSAFHGAGTLSINSKPASMEYFAHFEKSELENGHLLKDPFSKEDNINSEMNDEEKIELPQQFELDLSGNNYEKIDVVPKGSNRFVHDFYSNYTAIVDIENQLCFIMPLDRNVTLPPNNLYDLLFKMSGGYYSLDTEKIRREMRKVEPSIKNLDTFGIYIKKECEEFTTFMLEKIVSGVTEN